MDVTGLEPVTPTMSTRQLKPRNDFQVRASNILSISKYPIYTQNSPLTFNPYMIDFVNLSMSYLAFMRGESHAESLIGCPEPMGLNGSV